MATRPNVIDLGSLQNESTAVANINSNVNKLADSIKDLLSTTAYSENTMNVPLDMNGQRIINTAPPVAPYDVMRKADIDSYTDTVNDLLAFIRANPGSTDTAAALASLEARKFDKTGGTVTGNTTFNAPVTFSPTSPVTFGQSTAISFAARPSFGSNTPWDSGNLKHIVNVRDMGLKGDSVTDDTAALQALSNVPSGTCLVFPAGTYFVTDGVTFVNKDITLVGAGVGSTTIYLYGNNKTLINIFFNDILFRANISGFTFISNGTGNTCISIVKPQANSNVFQGPVISNNEFKGGDPNAQEFSICIYLEECYHFRVICNQATGSNLTFGMTFLSLKGHCTDGTVFDNRVAVAFAGVATNSGGISEGIQIQFNKFVGVQIGIFLDNGVSAPGGQICFNHINSYVFGVRIIGRPQIQIFGNLFYKFKAGDWVGIQLESCALVQVQQNQTIGFKNLSGRSIGLFASNVPKLMVLDNQYQDCATGIDFSNSSFGVDDRNMFTACNTNRNAMNASGHNTGSAFSYSS